MALLKIQDKYLWCGLTKIEKDIPISMSTIISALLQHPLAFILI
jgi:hypothetical protein